MKEKMKRTTIIIGNKKNKARSYLGREGDEEAATRERAPEDLDNRDKKS